MSKQKKDFPAKEQKVSSQEQLATTSSEQQTHVTASQAYQHFQHNPRTFTPTDSMILQRTIGNAAVARLLRKAQQTNPPTNEQTELKTRISSAKGAGQPLDESVQRTLEQGLGADLSPVRVHTDTEADHLSRSVNATAFTTGADIFFRSGAYNPGTSQGLHLLAHEATHIVQQATGPVAATPVPGGISVSDPNDSFERAAEANATRLTNHTIPVQRTIKAPSMPQQEEKTNKLSHAIQRNVDQGSLILQRQPSFEAWSGFKDIMSISKSTIDGYLAFLKGLAEYGKAVTQKEVKTEIEIKLSLIDDAMNMGNRVLAVELCNGIARLLRSSSSPEEEKEDKKPDQLVVVYKDTKCILNRPQGLESLVFTIFTKGHFRDILKFIKIIMKERPTLLPMLLDYINDLYSMYAIDVLFKEGNLTEFIRAVAWITEETHQPCQFSVRRHNECMGYLSWLQTSAIERITANPTSIPNIKLQKCNQILSDLIFDGINTDNIIKIYEVIQLMIKIYNPFSSPTMPKQTVFTDRLEGYPTVMHDDGLYPLGFPNIGAWITFVNGAAKLIRDQFPYITHIIFQGSAINGISYKVKDKNAVTKEFDQGRVSDYDISLVCPMLHAAIQQRGAKMGSVIESERNTNEDDPHADETVTPPLHQHLLSELGLAQLWIQFRTLINRSNTLFNREINFMIYRTVEAAQRHEGPSLIIMVGTIMNQKFIPLKPEIILSGKLGYRGPRPSKK